MKNNVMITKSENGEMILRRGKRACRNCFDAPLPLRIAEKRCGQMDGRLNRVCVSGEVLQGLDALYVTLVNERSGRFMDVFVDSAAGMDRGEIRLTAVVADALEAHSGEAVLLCPRKAVSFRRIMKQKIGQVKEEAVVISAEEKAAQQLSQFDLFELYNPLTRDAIVIRARHIIADETLKTGEIRINQRQRSMLGENVPCRLSTGQWQQAMAALAEEKELQAAMAECYMQENGQYTLSGAVGEMPFARREGLKKAIRLCFGERLVLQPVLPTYLNGEKRSPLQWLCDFYAGRSVLSLNARRPHLCDELADIVRMTEDNMRYMGLESMDKVILQYKRKRIACHVMPLERDKFDMNNVASLPELSIGIPVHIRSRLGLHDLQSAVKVDRDTGFILRKSINEQLVPALLTLVSLSFFESFTVWQKALLSLVAIPVILYFNLSSKRNMRGK